MLQIKWNQRNEERVEIIRYLPNVSDDSRTYFEKWLDDEEY